MKFMTAMVESFKVYYLNSLKTKQSRQISQKGYSVVYLQLRKICLFAGTRFMRSSKSFDGMDSSISNI